MKAAIGIIIAIVVLGGGYYFYSGATDKEIEGLPKIGDVMDKDGDAMKKDGDAMDKSGYAVMEEGDAMEKDDSIMTEEGFDKTGALEDVSGGTASGDAKARFKDGVYTLVATFEGLSEPQGTDFYEGWVVRRGDAMSVISTGRVDVEEIGYVDHYIANENLLDHDFYVLTLEPDDGDPAPAAHILDGELK